VLSSMISERAVSEEQHQIEDVVAPGARGDVCMIAYTFYAFDARVRREAETLVAHGFRVRFLTPRAGAKAGRFLVNGVEVRELPVAKYRGKSQLAYLASYVWFALAASAVCQCYEVFLFMTPDVVFCGAALGIGASMPFWFPLQNTSRHRQ